MLISRDLRVYMCGLTTTFRFVDSGQIQFTFRQTIGKRHIRDNSAESTQKQETQHR